MTYVPSGIVGSSGITVGSPHGGISGISGITPVRGIPLLIPGCDPGGIVGSGSSRTGRRGERVRQIEARAMIKLRTAGRYYMTRANSAHRRRREIWS
jgi:hypothetical protein